MSSSIAGHNVAVTGATGFLGRYITRALLARGAQVVGVVRNPDRVPELAATPGVTLRRADLGDTAALTRALAGVDAVVANAALFSVGTTSWQAHLEANVRGTDNLFAAAAAAGVGRVVQVSSVAVYRGHTGGRVAEDHPQHSEASARRPTNTYAISKAVSEQRAWRAATAQRAQLTVVRPSMIFGAHDRNITPWLRRVARLPLMPAMAQLSLVYAGDVAEGVAATLERDESVGRAYNLCGDESTVWPLLLAFARADAASSARAPLRLPLPLPLSRMFDNARAKRELGFSNRPVQQAVAETLALERGAAAAGG